jgi:hypothetical protein
MRDAVTGFGRRSEAELRQGVPRRRPRGEVTGESQPWPCSSWWLESDPAGVWPYNRQSRRLDGMSRAGCKSMEAWSQGTITDPALNI